MSGRLLRRVSGIVLVVSTLCLFSPIAGAAAADETAADQGSWNPLSFFLEYLSELLPQGSPSSSDGPKNSTDASNAGESGGGTTGEDDGEVGPGIDPSGNP